MHLGRISRRNFLQLASSYIPAEHFLGKTQNQAGQYDPGLSWVNVKTAPYNAVGDGKTDDRAAIQQALDDVQKAGGGGIFLPPGTYLLGGSLLLRDTVGIYGANPYVSTLKLGNGANVPVLSDSGTDPVGAYAFGRTHLQDFSIDGNGANNSSPSDGIYTTAYFSTFKDLSIHDCNGNGIHIAAETMLNNASQDEIISCRIDNCGGAAIFLDIHSVDHTISQNYLSHCEVGLVIRNGGTRIVNNDIYGHASAGILVTQTVYGLIIGNNDFNANKRHAIYITRTDKDLSDTWGNLLICGNSILGDGLEKDATYDGIIIETGVPGGITGITLVGNKIFTLGPSRRFQYGINFSNNVTYSQCSGNHIEGWANARYYVNPNCKMIDIDSIAGGELSPPPLPASGKPLLNPYSVPTSVYISGGSVSAIDIDGVPTGLSNGSFHLRGNQTITLSYHKPPQWTWIAD